MNLNKVEPKYISKSNPRIGLITLGSDFRIEKDFNNVIYGREAINMNKEADLKDQAKNFRLFDETLTVMKKAWTEEYFKSASLFMLIASLPYIPLPIPISTLPFDN